MTIIINGQEKTFQTPLSITELLAREGFADKTVAVAINGTFVPKSTHADVIIDDGADIEIVAPMQGG